ncbi:MAG: magnesium transporter [Acidimicrobiia bacterium]|nr:magnesium transporter [Acidimicrobiia bacterium]
MQWILGPARRLRALLGDDAVAATQSLSALLVSSVFAVLAGVILASVTGQLEDMPGLLLLVPAAIALRGNVFGALGSRLGTAIHAGTFQLRVRRDTLVGQNIVAAALLSLVLSVVIAALAKAVAIAFDLSPTLTLLEFIVVSAIGGVLASAVVLGITLLLAAGSVRYGWDLDNVTAPLVTATGDMVTVPALLVGTLFIDHGALTTVLAVALVTAAAIGVVAALRSSLDRVRQITIESLPVLAVAGVLDLVAGVTIEKRADEFFTYESLLVLLPAYLGLAGALGGILSSRLSTGLHLGLVAPSPVPGRPARRSMVGVFALGLPVFALIGATSHLAAEVAGYSHPGLGRMVAVAVSGGVFAVILVVLVAYYGTLAAVRLGLDPDTYGIPLVTSTLDVAGAFTLILAIVAWGLS